MDKTDYAFWMTVTGTLCWAVCFWWMHRISSKQNALLDQLREQGKRIEKVSKIEHDLIKEVHPQVAEIKEGIDTMVSAAKGIPEHNLHRDAESASHAQRRVPPAAPPFGGQAPLIHPCNHAPEVARSR